MSFACPLLVLLFSSPLLLLPLGVLPSCCPVILLALSHHSLSFFCPLGVFALFSFPHCFCPLLSLPCPPLASGRVDSCHNSRGRGYLAAPVRPNVQQLQPVMTQYGRYALHCGVLLDHFIRLQTASSADLACQPFKVLEGISQGLRNDIIRALELLPDKSILGSTGELHKAGTHASDSVLKTSLGRSMAWMAIGLRTTSRGMTASSTHDYCALDPDSRCFPVARNRADDIPGRICYEGLTKGYETDYLHTETKRHPTRPCHRR